MSISKNKIVFVVNTPGFFLSHRLPLAKAAKNTGLEVHVATANGPGIDTILSNGFVHHVVPFSRSGQNPYLEMKTIFFLLRLFYRLRPRLVHLVTIKPVLYGGLVSRILGIDAVVFAVSGLGTVFLEKSVIGKFRKAFVLFFFRAAFKNKRYAAIFQNIDDQNELISSRVVLKSRSYIIKGSGVALHEYPFYPEPNGRVVVAMAARLLKDKGVYEFVQAARLLDQKGVNVEMRLIGAPDHGNPTSITQQELDAWSKEGVISLLGHREDIAHQYAVAHIACLPSYREGLPKGLIEAAACGRCIVTTDVPGCRDAIIPEKTGVLVPVKDAAALAAALEALVKSPLKRQRMGRAGRNLAESVFAIENIVEKHLHIYNSLLD